MTTMLEKAARAARAYMESVNADEHTADVLTLGVARAVLMAVREPGDETGGPVDVGYETMRHREVTTHKDARVCFTAMIDAILNEEQG